MNVLLTGGGTAGHITPALAIADTLKANNKDVNIAFVGTPKGMENRLVGKEGYRMYHIAVKSFKRSLAPSNLVSAYLAFASPIKAKKIIREFHPDVVVGTGGYVCWPILVAASRMGIPTVVHEANAYPGMATKRLSPYVDRILLNYADAAKYLKYPKKTVYTGNPLRASVGSVSREDARRAMSVDEKYRFVVLSYGGSLGSLAINENMIEYLHQNAEKHPDVLFIHACGKTYSEEMFAKFSAYGLDKTANVRMYDYIYDMPVKMAAADLVICRAGAMTVSEIALSRKNAIFIPSPNVTENHQYKNAEALSKAGAAVLLPEDELTPQRLAYEIDSILCDDAKRLSMKKAVGTFANENANKAVYDEIMKVMKK